MTTDANSHLKTAISDSKPAPTEAEEAPVIVRKLSRAEVRQRSEAHVTHGIYRTRTGLGRQDRRRLQRYERELLSVLPWILPSDAVTVRSFAHLLLMRDKIASALSDRGVLSPEGDVTRLASELRQTLASLLAYSREMGLTPASRAALGLTVARQHYLAADADVSTEDVVALESRLLERLGAKHDAGDEHEEDGDDDERER